MPKTPSIVDSQALYAAALEGLELQRQRLDEQIRHVKSMLSGRKASAPAGEAAEAAPKSRKAAKKRGKRVLSEEARERIAAAQRKRWAAYRKEADE